MIPIRSCRGGVIVATPWLWACSPRTFPLDEVPVIGGDSEQRQLVRSALQEFERAAGPGRVRLSEVAFDSDDLDGAVGRYFADHRRIALGPNLGPAVPEVIRHELCHALDHQEMLTPTIIGALHAAVGAFRDARAFDDHFFPSAGDEVIESFALLCERGPEVAALLVEPCADDPADVSNVYSWMMDRVWTGETWFQASEVAGSDMVSWQADADVDAFHVGPGYVGGEPLFDVIVLGSSVQWVTLDPYTGEFVAIDWTLPIEEESNDLDDDIVVPFDGGTLSMQAGWSEGPAIALAEARIPDLGNFRRVTYRFGEGPWGRIPELCPAEVMDLVALDNRVWYAWANADVVSWTAFAP